MGYYRSNDPTNSVKAPKEELRHISDRLHTNWAMSLYTVLFLLLFVSCYASAARRFVNPFGMMKYPRS